MPQAGQCPPGGEQGSLPSWEGDGGAKNSPDSSPLMSHSSNTTLQNFTSAANETLLSREKIIKLFEIGTLRDAVGRWGA